MKKILGGMVLLLAIAAYGCSGNKQSDKTAETNTADTTNRADSLTQQNDSALLGTFEGTMPAADCEGIKKTLTLNKNNTFDLVEDYIGKEKFTSKGDYTLENNLLCTISEQQDTTFYKVDGNKLKMLNKDMQEASGEFADMYTLTKK